MYDYRFNEDEVIRALGLEEASEAMRNGVIDGIYDQLYKRMHIRLESLMTDDDVEHFNRLSDDESNAWLKERFPNSNEMFDEELDALIDEMSGYADTAASASGV